MIFGSVCSGIEAASVAWEPIGWRAAWFAEIEPFPCSVLEHHWPQVPNHGDMTMLAAMVSAGHIPAPDVLVGGTPCQAFSVAGRRESLDDERGQLTLSFTRLADEIDNRRKSNGLGECIIVWENVPGVLSTKDNAFGCFLGELAGSCCELQPTGKRWPDAGCVFGPKRTIAWRVLDAQYFGVAQRRRRVFVVASARDGFDPAAVLFESEGVRRDTAPSREAGQVSTANAGTSFTPTGFGQYKSGIGTLRASGGDLGGGSEVLITNYRKLTCESFVEDETASTMAARDYKSATELICVHGTQDPVTSKNLAQTLGRNNGQENAVYGIPWNWIGRKPENGGNAVEPMNNISPCLTSADRHGVAAMQVRRLTPTECERLQGFPEGQTAIEYKGKPAPDGQRYKALGNSMAVPVMRWIGERIKKEIEK